MRAPLHPCSACRPSWACAHAWRLHGKSGTAARHACGHLAAGLTYTHAPSKSAADAMSPNCRLNTHRTTSGGATHERRRTRSATSFAGGGARGTRCMSALRVHGDRAARMRREHRCCAPTCTASVTSAPPAPPPCCINCATAPHATPLCLRGVDGMRVNDGSLDPSTAPAAAPHVPIFAGHARHHRLQKVCRTAHAACKRHVCCLVLPHDAGRARRCRTACAPRCSPEA